MILTKRLAGLGFHEKIRLMLTLRIAFHKS